MPLLKLIPPQYLILARLVAVAIVIATSFAIGYEWRDRSCDLTEARAQAADLKAQNDFRQGLIDTGVRRDYVTKSNTERFEATRQEQAEKARVITREVIRYVSETPVSDRVDLPGEWLRIHDASADPGLPAAAGAAGEPDDTPARTASDADALRVITENYQVCLSEFTRLRHLQEWYRAQQAITMQEK